MHVPLGGAQVFVSRQLLNGPCGRTPHRQMRAERVAQDVDPVVLQPCSAGCPPYPVLHHLLREWSAALDRQDPLAAQMAVAA